MNGDPNMGDLCSFCKHLAKYYTVSNENQMVARCDDHAGTGVPNCVICGREATKCIPAADNGNAAYYCEVHPWL